MHVARDTHHTFRSASCRIFYDQEMKTAVLIRTATSSDVRIERRIAKKIRDRAPKPNMRVVMRYPVNLVPRLLVV